MASHRAAAGCAALGVRRVAGGLVGSLVCSWMPWPRPDLAFRRWRSRQQDRPQLRNCLGPLRKSHLEAGSRWRRGSPGDTCPWPPARRAHVVLVHAQRHFLRRPPGDGAVERATQRVDIRPGTLQAVVGGVLLVRRVAGLDDAGERAAHLGDGPPRRTEIEQHRAAVGAHDDVVGRDVAMQEVLRVHHLQRVEQGGDDPVELILRGRPAEVAQPGLEALALLEAHDHVGGGVGLERARDAHDARMLEARQRTRLLQEVGTAPVEGLLVAADFGFTLRFGVAIAEVEGIVFLHGDRRAEGDVLGLVGDAEATRADHPL